MIPDSIVLSQSGWLWECGTHVFHVLSDINNHKLLVRELLSSV